MRFLPAPTVLASSLGRSSAFPLGEDRTAGVSGSSSLCSGAAASPEQASLVSIPAKASQARGTVHCKPTSLLLPPTLTTEAQCEPGAIRGHQIVLFHGYLSFPSSPRPLLRQWWGVVTAQSRVVSLEKGFLCSSHRPPPPLPAVKSLNPPSSALNIGDRSIELREAAQMEQGGGANARNDRAKLKAAR